MYNPTERARAFTSRLGRGSTPELTRDIELAFKIPASAREKADAIRRDTSLSPSGHKFQIARMVGSGLTQHLQQLRSSAAKQLQEAKAARAQLTLKPDRTDTFAETQRAEVRTWLRSLSYPERLRVLGEANETVNAAIAFAPTAAMAGLTEEQRSQVTEALVKSHHGERVAELDGRIEALEVCEDAYRLAADICKGKAGFRLLKLRAQQRRCGSKAQDKLRRAQSRISGSA